MRLLKKLATTVLLVALGAAPLHAAPSTPAGSPVPLLWQLGKGGSTVYLLGSFHLLREDDYPLAPEVEAAFADAESLVFEVAPSELDDPATTRRALEIAGFDNGGRLGPLLTDGVRANLDAMLAGRDASAAHFDRYEPWFVNLTLVMGISDRMGFRTEHGLDRHLMGRAVAARKPMTGLETVESQMRALESTPLGEQLASLSELVADPDAMRDALDQLHTAWRRGDVERLEALTRVEMLKSTPETYRLLNVERNRAWLPQLRRMLDGSPDHDVLVVVGAMHLLGDEGLIAQLRSQGYVATRLGGPAAASGSAAATSAHTDAPPGTGTAPALP